MDRCDEADVSDDNDMTDGDIDFLKQSQLKVVSCVPFVRLHFVDA